MDEAFVEDTAMEDEAVSADIPPFRSRNILPKLPLPRHLPAVKMRRSRRDTSILTIRSS